MKLLADSAEGVGYLLKDRSGDVKDFTAAVRRVADGGSALDPIIVSTLTRPNTPENGPRPGKFPALRPAAAGGRLDGSPQPGGVA